MENYDSRIENYDSRIENDNTNTLPDNNDIFDENKFFDEYKERRQENDEVKNRDNSQSESLKMVLLYNKKDIINNLNLSNYPIEDEDFSVVVKNGTPIICAKSSYFSSLIGLNGPKEKGKCLNNKVSREIYDKFDDLLKDLLNSQDAKDDAEKQLIEYCQNNGIDYESIKADGGCVVSDGSNYFIGLKQLARSKNLDKNEGTILHEQQHIKFDKYCREKNIEKNGYIKILNEVIAHCCNTKDKDGNIDFNKIQESMIINTNYSDISGFLEDYGLIVLEIIQDVKNNLESNNLDETMKKLINKYKN